MLKVNPKFVRLKEASNNGKFRVLVPVLYRYIGLFSLHNKLMRKVLFYKQGTKTKRK